MTEPQQKQKIGISTAIIVGMNAMIGAGIFTAPAALTSDVGPAGILAYAFVIVSVWLMALSVARVASLYPGEGSFYSYAKQWGGHRIGVLATSSYLIGLLIAMGLLSQVAGSYLHDYFPFLSPQHLGLLALVIIVIFNMIGVKLSELGQIILILLTIIPLLITIFIGFAHAKWYNLIPFAPYGFKNVISATKAVIFGFFGFEAAASLYPIVKDPIKNVPKALTYSIILVGILYLVFVSSIVLSIPLTEFTNPEIKVTTLLLKAFPEYKWLVLAMGISILSAVLGTLHSMIWSSSTLLLTFLKKFNNNITKNITQSNYNKQIAVFILGFFIFLSAITFKNLDLFFSFTAIFLIIAYTSTMITLLVKTTTIKDKLITIGGLLTASVIFLFAVQEIIIQIIGA